MENGLFPPAKISYSLPYVGQTKLSFSTAIKAHNQSFSHQKWLFNKHITHSSTYTPPTVQSIVLNKKLERVTARTCMRGPKTPREASSIRNLLTKKNAVNSSRFCQSIRIIRVAEKSGLSKRVLICLVLILYRVQFLFEIGRREILGTRNRRLLGFTKNIRELE